MRAKDLDLRELLAFEPKGGILRFAGERALLFDAVALGLLRKALIETLGEAGARGVLTRFGFAHGWRTAETLRTAFPWDDEDEWRHAGGRLHTLQGLVVAVTPEGEPAPGPKPLGDSVWLDSYEAEQHLVHLGRADQPVCWTLTGFASGYLSRVWGREVFALETRCRGKGDAACRLVARPREEWGDQIAAELPYYAKDCLDATVGRLAGELRRVERQLRARRQELGPQIAPQFDPAGLVMASEAMRRVVDLARRVAQVDSTVLVTGESGVGKERVARLIHDASARAGGPFVAINCGAVPEGLLESELFGHARGAFTGAAQDRPGLFEAASGGTLLLDEIGDVPPPMQVKLLRALQEREVRRVGENRNRKVDARVLAATNRDLTAEVHSARFRQDLYYRLRVVEIRVPPLRERRDDILPLARTFLLDAVKRLGRKVTGFTPAAAQQLVRYDWPGNVRELENAIERAVVLARGNRIDAAICPRRSASPCRLPPRPARSSRWPRSSASTSSRCSVRPVATGPKRRAGSASAQRRSIGSSSSTGRPHGDPRGRGSLLIHAAGEEAAVDDEYLAVDEAGGVRSEEHRGSGELFDAAEAREGGAELELTAAFGAIEEVLVQRRVEDPRRDGVDQHASGSPLDGERPGQRRHATLAGGVRGDLVQADERGERGDVDDAAVPALEHVGAEDLAGAKRAGQVGVEDALPLGVVDLERGAPLGPSGAVDQDVDLAEGLDGGLAERLQGGAVGDVAGEPQGVLAPSLDREGRGLDLRLPSRAGGDVGSCFHQAVDQGTSDAGGAAEYDRGASREVECCEGHLGILAGSGPSHRLCIRDPFESSATWRPAMIAGPTPLGSLATTRSLM